MDQRENWSRYVRIPNIDLNNRGFCNVNGLTFALYLEGAVSVDGTTVHPAGFEPLCLWRHVTIWSRMVFLNAKIKTMKMTAFWDIAPYSLVEVDRRSRGAYGLRYQDDFLPDYKAQYPRRLSLHTRRRNNLKSHMKGDVPVTDLVYKSLILNVLPTLSEPERPARYMIHCYSLIVTRYAVQSLRPNLKTVLLPKRQHTGSPVRGVKMQKLRKIMLCA
jgi:hypothetical protein